MNPKLQNWRNVQPSGSPGEGDEFLASWWEEARSAVASLKKEAGALDQSGRDRLAELSGFRSWRYMEEFLRHTVRVRERFLREPAFRELWSKLKLLDIEAGEPSYFGRHHGGVPGRLLQAIESWHQMPKFTKKERKQHGARISDLCNELELALSKVVPGSVGESELEGFWLSPEQVNALMRTLLTREDTLKGMSEVPDLAPAVGRYALQQAAITPLWAVRAIRDSAAKWGDRATGLPTKVRSAGAIKTYFIHVVETVLDHHLDEYLQLTSINDQLRAELAGLLANVDCSADDVRKATRVRRAYWRQEH